MFLYSLTRWRYIGLIASLLLVLTSLFSIYHYGLIMSIDFTGGTIIDIQMPTLLTISELQSMIQSPLKDSLIIRQGSEEGLWQLIIPINGTMIDPHQLISIVSQQLALPITLLQASVVGPQVGEELFNQGGLALLAASISIMAYLAIRFEWRLSLAAIASLIHDTILTFGLLAFLEIKIDLNVVAGLLAVIGYSLNDSIVIADRLRDILKAKPNSNIYLNTDLAIKATFARTLVTAGTTIFIIGCLLVMGGDALYGFSMTMFAGVLTGTWSSVTIASTIQELLGLSPEHYQPKLDLIDDMP